MKQSSNFNSLHRIVVKEDEVSSSEEGHLEKNTDGKNYLLLIYKPGDLKNRLNLPKLKNR